MNMQKKDREISLRILTPIWAAADGLGQITLLAMPFMIGGLVSSYGFTLSEAGLTLTIELGVLSVLGLVISPFMGRLSRRRVALAGAFIAFIGNAATLVADGVGAVFLCRAVAGAGYGLALAAGNAAVSNSEKPDLVYERKMLLLGLTVITVMLISPYITGRLGMDGLYGALAGTSLALAPLVVRLPEGKGAEPDREVVGDIFPSSLARAPVLAVAAILACISLYSLRESLAWGFSEIAGAELDVGAQTVGNLLAVSSALALLGPLTASFARRRVGIAAPAVTGAVLSGLVTYAVLTATGKPLFMSALVVWQFMYFFSVSLLLGLAARIDRKGRVVAASSSALLLAYAVGPALGGVLSEAGGAILGVFILASMTVSALLAAVAATQAGRT